MDSNNAEKWKTATPSVQLSGHAGTSSCTAAVEPPVLYNDLYVTYIHSVWTVPLHIDMIITVLIYL